MKGYVTNIEKDSLENNNFRKVLYTAPHCQLVLMSLLPKEEIGEEVHTLDQFIRIEQGQGLAVLNDIEYPIEDVEGFIFHQVRNYLHNGYWKDYHDLDGKKRLFEEFEYAKEQICKLYLSGINAEQILTHYSKINTKSIY